MTIDVHYTHFERDERTGEFFEWTNGFDTFEQAKAHAKAVNDQTIKDPFGKPWGPVKAVVVDRQTTA